MSSNSDLNLNRTPDSSPYTSPSNSKASTPAQSSRNSAVSEVFSANNLNRSTSSSNASLAQHEVNSKPSNNSNIVNIAQKTLHTNTSHNPSVISQGTPTPLHPNDSRTLDHTDIPQSADTKNDKDSVAQPDGGVTVAPNSKKTPLIISPTAIPHPAVKLLKSTAAFITGAVGGFSLSTLASMGIAAGMGIAKFTFLAALANPWGLAALGAAVVLAALIAGILLLSADSDIERKRLSRFLLLGYGLGNLAGGLTSAVAIGNLSSFAPHTFMNIEAQKAFALVTPGAAIAVGFSLSAFVACRSYDSASRYVPYFYMRNQYKEKDMNELFDHLPRLKFHPLDQRTVHNLTDEEIYKCAFVIDFYKNSVSDLFKEEESKFREELLRLVNEVLKPQNSPTPATQSEAANESSKEVSTENIALGELSAYKQLHEFLKRLVLAKQQF